MAKPNGIQWLEAQTGQTIEYTSEPPVAHDRHLSVRLPGELAAGLDALAAERGMTTSQCVRELLAAAVRDRESIASLDSGSLVTRLAADVAEVQRRLAS